MRYPKNYQDSSCNANVSILRQYQSMVIFSLLITISLTMGCEVDTALTIRDGNPPVFVMTGSGKLVKFRVLGPKKQREGAGNISDAYWEIVPDGGEENGKGVSEIRSVTYGKIPDGYIQVYPEKGEAPHLIEGEHYQVFAITYNANPAIKGFSVQNGKALEDTNR